VFASFDVSVYIGTKLINAEETARFTVKGSQLMETFVTFKKCELLSFGEFLTINLDQEVTSKHI